MSQLTQSAQVAGSAVAGWIGKAKTKLALGTGLSLATVAPALATEGDSSGIDFTLTEALIEPIETAVSSGLDVLIPVGIGIMAVFIGIGLIPRIIYKFF